MKTSTPHKRSNLPENPKFFDHIFYWAWHYTPSGGMPHRSFIAVTFVRLAFWLLPFAVASQFVGDDIFLHVYTLAEGHPAGLLTVLSFACFFWWDICCYKEKKYLSVQDYYDRKGNMERLRHRRRFFIYMALTLLAAVLDLWLYSLCEERYITILSEFSR